MIPILMYHEVNKEGKNPDGKIKMHPSCYLSASQFEEQMHYLHRNKFYSLTLKEIIDSNKRNNILLNNKKPIIITFDDGHTGNYKDAFPILKKYGFTATFFIATSWINKENMVSWNQLKEMIDGGMSVQSHTVSHPPLSTISDAQIKNELLESRKIIEKNLGVKVDFLSLPHGDFNSRVKIIAKQVGYKAIFSTDPKYFCKNNNNLLIGRIEIRYEDNMNYFISIVEKRCRLLIFLRLIKMIKFYFRSFIGVNNYRKLYRLINKIEQED